MPAIECPQTEQTLLLRERHILSKHLEPLFFRQRPKLSISKRDSNKSDGSIAEPLFASMVRILASSPAQSSTNRLLKRVFVQMSDLSEQLCSNLVKCVLNYAIELLGEIVTDGDDASCEEEPDNNVTDSKGEVDADCEMAESTQQQKPLEESSQESLVNANEQSQAAETGTEDVTLVEDENEIDSIYDTNFIDENSVSNFGITSPMGLASEDSKSLAELSQSLQGNSGSVFD